MPTSTGPQTVQSRIPPPPPPLKTPTNTLYLTRCYSRASNTMFDIFLTKEVIPEAGPGVVALYGKICIGDYQETFIASLYSWNEAMYLQHWESALRRLVEGETKSATHHLVCGSNGREVYLLVAPVSRRRYGICSKSFAALQSAARSFFYRRSLEINSRTSNRDPGRSANLRVGN